MVVEDLLIGGCPGTGLRVWLGRPPLDTESGCVHCGRMEPTDIPAVRLLLRVNEIAETTEDAREIRDLIAEARIEPGCHLGDFDSFDEVGPQLAAEFALGQWADIIDRGGLFALNGARNYSARLAAYILLMDIPDAA